MLSNCSDGKDSWEYKEIKQSILNESNSEYSLEGLMLKLQYSGHLRWRANSLEKTLMLGKIEGRRRRGDKGWDYWMASSTQWAWIWADIGKQWKTGKPGELQSRGLQRVRHNWATEQQWRERWRILVLPLGEPWECDVLLIRCTERCWSLLGKPVKIEPCLLASFLLLSFFLPGTQLRRWNWNHRETMWRDTNHSCAEIQKNHALITFRLAIIYGKWLEACQVSNL